MYNKGISNTFAEVGPFSQNYTLMHHHRKKPMDKRYSNRRILSQHPSVEFVLSVPFTTCFGIIIITCVIESTHSIKFVNVIWHLKPLKTFSHSLTSQLLTIPTRFNNYSDSWHNFSLKILEPGRSSVVEHDIDIIQICCCKSIEEKWKFLFYFDSENNII